MATLDPKIQKLLNDFSKSQPALQQVGVPAATAGVQLGDLLAQALLGAASSDAYSPTTPGNWSPTPSTVGAALDQAAPGIAVTREAAVQAAAAADATSKANAAATAGHTYSAATPSNWAGSAPSTDSTALDRLTAAMDGLLAKLDADAGVTDTNYLATWKP